jgi:hypothetical protein
VLGVAQPDVSNIHRGRLAGFSMERLYRFLNALGQDVMPLAPDSCNGRQPAGREPDQRRCRTRSRSTTVRNPSI